MRGKLLSLAAAGASLAASATTGLAQNIKHGSRRQDEHGRSHRAQDRNTGVRQMGKSGVQGDVGKGVRDTHSTGQDVKQQRSGMGMSTEGGKNNLAAL